MRFLQHPEDLLLNKHPMMFHTSGFAIAAGVVAVGAAAGSAAISMSAADRAKRGQGKAAASFKKGQREVQGMINAVEAPKYDLGSMIGDAGQVSKYYRQQLEKFQPGAAAQRKQATTQVGQAMDVISQYLRGEVPQDVREQIMRNVAESAGAGFNPAAAGQVGGFQAAQGQMARNLGLTSLDIQGRGLAAMPSVQNTAMNWQQLARAFTADPLEVGKLQLGFQTAGAEVGLQKARMTAGVYENIYGANKENIAASYAAQQAVGQGVSDIGKATSGALSGYSNVLAGFSYGGQSGNPYGTGLGATPLYNTPRASSGTYLGGSPATGSMSDRPVALPT
jgi:hypothetical protein